MGEATIFKSNLSGDLWCSLLPDQNNIIERSYNLCAIGEFLFPKMVTR